MGVPTGHASVKLAGVSVAGSIAAVKAAVISFVLTGTRVALVRGATKVTWGGVEFPLGPRIDDPPPLPPPPHPAIKTLNINVINHISGLAILLAAPPVILSNLFISVSSLI
jgi:hypothetical protein